MKTTTTTKAFSYLLWDAESAENFPKKLERDFVSFLKTGRGGHPNFEVAFNNWWIIKGPTGFYTTEDAFRYRRELKAYIIGVLTKLSEPEAANEPA